MFFIFEGAVGAIILILPTHFSRCLLRAWVPGDYQIGLVSSLPALVAIFALIPGSLFVDRSPNKKRIVCFLALLFGVIYPLAVFTKRTHTATFLGTTASLTAGLLLAYVPKTEAQRIMMYQLFFVLDFVFAIVQSWLLNKVQAAPVIKDNTEKSGNVKLMLDSLYNLAKNKEFRLFAIISVIFHISWYMGWPLFFIYQVDVVGINEAWLSYVNVAIGVAGMSLIHFGARL